MASLLLNFRYLSANNLHGFDKYKYKSIDNSPLSNYVMHPLWDQIVKIYPLWLPANALTLFGWLLSLLNFVVLSYYDPDFTSSSDINKQTVPPWVWMLGAWCIFLAHQLDGTDGKQARRTNSCSPLGELFDHGLDSSTVVFMCLGIISLFGIGEETAYHWEVLLVYSVVLMAFWIAHWEKYNTSVMFLPWAYDISQIWLAASYLLTFFYGIGIWKGPVLMGLNFPFLFKKTLHILVLVFVIPMSVYNQIKGRRENPSDCKSVTEGLMPILSLGSVTALYLCFGYFSLSNIVVNHLRLYVFGYGVLYSNINCRLIVSQMSGSLCDRFNILAWPLFLLLILQQLQLVDEYKMLLAYIVVISIAHIHYGVNVVRQLCTHLNIYCFRVAKPKPIANGHFHSNGISNGKVD